MTEQTRAIIDFAYDNNGKEMRDALYTAINDKVMAHIEAHRQQVAQNLVSPQETVGDVDSQEGQEEQS